MDGPQTVTVGMSPRINVGNYSTLGLSVAITRVCANRAEVDALICDVREILATTAVEERQAMGELLDSFAAMEAQKGPCEPTRSTRRLGG